MEKKTKTPMAIRIRKAVLNLKKKPMEERISLLVKAKIIKEDEAKKAIQQLEENREHAS